MEEHSPGSPHIAPHIGNAGGSGIADPWAIDPWALGDHSSAEDRTSVKIERAECQRNNY